MYLIIVYDAGPKKGIKLLKYLRRHLLWVQNSVFEGEVTESE
ncbi:MAG: CRISPR-associated endonuclease Cas2, partial [Melioribacter sp. RIFOXYB12_FULL_38_5]